MTDRPTDDAFEDDEYGDDPFADYAPPAAAPAQAPAGDAGDDPFELEPVLDDDYQATPNSYNVRNIVLIAAGGFVLVLVAFLFSMSGGDDAATGLEVAGDARGIPAGAQAPDVTMRPDIAPQYGEPEDLSVLLDEPALASGGSGGYGPAAPRAAAISGPQNDEPSYLDRRREAFLSAMGRPSSRSVGTLPQGQAAPMYMVDAMGNVIGPAPGSDPNAVYTDASANQGLVQQTGSGFGGGGGQSWRPGQPGTGGSAAAMRPAGVQAQPEFSTFTLPKGTLMNLTIETEVNSDLGGVFIARTTEDIYDRTRRHVLIPRGSQVVSAYGDGDVVGSRLEARVERLNLPDGRSVDFSRAGLYDLQGKRGVTDVVHKHTAARVGAGVLRAAAGIGGAVAGRRVQSERILIRNPDGSTSSIPVEDDVSAEAARRGANGADQAAQSITDRTLNRPNTVILRAGLRVLVIVEDDIDMGRPYYQSGAVPTGRSPYDVRPARRGAGAAPRLPRAPQIPQPPPVRSSVRTVGAQSTGGQ